MRLKIRCDRESEKFYKICWELNKARVQKEPSQSRQYSSFARTFLFDFYMIFLATDPVAEK